MLQATHIKIFKDQHPVLSYTDAKKLILDLYTFAKEHLESYSYLQLSEDLGFARTNLTYLLAHGKRKLTLKTATKIADKLGLSKQEKDFWLSLVEYQTSRNKVVQDKAFKRMLGLRTKHLSSSDDKVRLGFFAEWYHITIYEMIKLRDFKNDPENIAAALNPSIRPEQARKSLKLLEELDLICFDELNNCWRQTSTQISTGDEIASLAITSYHKTMISQAQMSLTECEAQLRDISAISIAVPLKMVPELKAEISRFRKHLLAIAEEAKNAEAVYQVNIQLFPTTKIDKQEKSAS